MSALLVYLFWLVGLTVGVFLVTRSPQRRSWRKRLLLIVVAAWVVYVGVLLAGILHKRPFFDAVKSGDMGRVKALLAGKPALIHSKTFMGATALHLAVVTGNTNMVALLLKSGADVNAMDSSRIDPLALGARNGNVSIAEILLRAGADVNSVGGRHDDTPLHVAAFNGNLGMVKLLLAHGANVNAEDMLHKTPLQLAQDDQKTNVVAVLTNPPPAKE